MSRLTALLVLLSALLVPASVPAQVAAPSYRPLFLNGYALASRAQPEFIHGNALGGSGGFILEHNRMVAIDFRGTMLRSGVPLHTYIAEAGPRIAPRFSPHWQPFGELLAGYAHSGYPVKGQTLLSRGFGIVWTADAGFDLRLRYGLDWRVADLSYSHIYAGTGASPIILNTGVVYRFHAPGASSRPM